MAAEPELAHAVVREIQIDARPETVFGFLTDPELIVRWEGIEAQAEPVPGGIYRVVVNSRSTMLGEFVEVVPHRRVVFTWGFEQGDPNFPPGASTVEISLEPDGDGTRLRLVHRSLPADWRDRHVAGWDHYLERLGGAAAGRDPGADAWA